MIEGVDSHDPDADLVRRVGQGDAAAARRLVAIKLPRLLALGTRILGDGPHLRFCSPDNAKPDIMRTSHATRRNLPFGS